MTSTERITVRRAVESDFAEILKIETLCFAEHPWDLMALRQYDCSVAFLGTALAGFLISRSIGAPTPGSGEFEILNLAVHPFCRRRGVARALLNSELARGGEHFLEVRESNVSARKLYENLGFVEIGQRKAYYSKPEESAIVMKRK
jgi:ribosomal-protein-alanine N-acetyltransferase